MLNTPPPVNSHILCCLQVHSAWVFKTFACSSLQSPLTRIEDRRKRGGIRELISQETQPWAASGERHLVPLNSARAGICQQLPVTEAKDHSEPLVGSCNSPGTSHPYPQRTIRDRGGSRSGSACDLLLVFGPRNKSCPFLPREMLSLSCLPGPPSPVGTEQVPKQFSRQSSTFNFKVHRANRQADQVKERARTGVGWRVGNKAGPTRTGLEWEEHRGRDSLEHSVCTEQILNSHAAYTCRWEREGSIY